MFSIYVKSRQEKRKFKVRGQRQKRAAQWCSSQMEYTATKAATAHQQSITDMRWRTQTGLWLRCATES